jgi:hypothetical protein
MKKLFAFTLVMAMPASAASVVSSPALVQNPGAASAVAASPRQWVRAPLSNGGYARCKNPNGCRTWVAPHNEVVAEYGEVMEGALFDGWSAAADGYPPVQILVVHAIGSNNVPYTGIYSRADDWEGVA